MFIKKQKTFLIGLLLAIGLPILIFFSTWKSMAEIWMRSDTYTHAFFIPLISLWLIWKKQNALNLNTRQPARLALLFILANSLLWLLGDIISAQVVKQYAAVGLLTGSIWLYLGHRLTWQLFFPIALLYLMPPFGEDFLPFLMNFTANSAVKLLRLSHIPVYQEGLFISLPSGNWSVIEACSGLRYLIASVTLGLVFAYITYTHWLKRVIFIVASVIVPILANSIRAYMIVLMGHLSNMEVATGADHLIYGAFFFAIIMFLLFFIGSFWRDPVPAYNINLPSHRPIQSSNTQFYWLFAGLLALLPGPLASHHIQQNFLPSLALIDSQSVQWPSPWQASEQNQWLSTWLPQLRGAQNESTTYYSDGKNYIAVYQANFGNETQSAELVSTDHNLDRKINRHWGLSSIKNKIISLPEYPQFEVQEGLMKKHTSTGENYLLVYSFYKIGHHYLINPYQAKIMQLIKRLTFNESPELFIRLIASSRTPQAETARQNLTAYTAAIVASHQQIAP